MFVLFLILLIVMLHLLKIILKDIFPMYPILYVVNILILILVLILFSILTLIICLLLQKLLHSTKRVNIFPLRISLTFIKQLKFNFMKEENKKVWSTILTIVKYIATALLGAIGGSAL